MSSNAAARRRLAEYVARRREQLGLTQKQVHERGGPSDTTVGNIENEKGAWPRGSTAAGLEEALAWWPGSIANIAQGEPPFEKPLGMEPVEGPPEDADLDEARARLSAGIRDKDAGDEGPIRLAERLAWEHVDAGGDPEDAIRLLAMALRLKHRSSQYELAARKADLQEGSSPRNE